MGSQPWWMTRDFDYIKVPKGLFRSVVYAAVSPSAKLLYGFLLDRASLSAVNGEAWIDESGNCYVYYTIAEIMERFGCRHEKASALLKELEKANLINRTRKSRVKPYRIVVLPFVRSTPTKSSRERRMTKNECGKEDTNKTDWNQTDMNHTEIITPHDRENVVIRIQENIDYDVLLEQIPQQQLDGIVDVIVDTICTQAIVLRIGNRILSQAEVCRRLWELDQMDILYVRDRINREKIEIRYMRSYILTCLYDAKTLGDTYYAHWAKLDMNN